MDFTNSCEPEEHTIPTAREKSLPFSDSEQRAWALSQPPLHPSPPPHPCSTNPAAPPSPPTEADVGRTASLYPSNALTNFSGVLTMAKVDSSFSQYSLLLFQDISKVDKKKHLPRWKSHLLGQTKDIQEKSVRFFITVGFLYNSCSDTNQPQSGKKFYPV